MRKRRWATALLATVLLVPTTHEATAAPPPTKDRTVTLITGDKVVVHGTDVSIVGRDHIGFEVRRTPREWTVIPSDVRGAVANKEVESYNVTLTALGADGKPAPAGSVYPSLQNLDTLESADFGRVAKGRYAVDVTMFGPAGEHYRIVQPELDVHRDTNLVVDARTAKPVKITVPRKDAKTFVVFFGYQLTTKTGESTLTFNLQPEGEKLYLGRMGRAVPAQQFQGFVASYVGRLAPDGTLTDTPYVYGLINTQPGHFFNGLQRRIYSDHQLAHVVVDYKGPADADTQWALAGRQPGVQTLPIAAPVKLPTTVHQYLEPHTDWQQMLGETEHEPRQYRAGTTTHETVTFTG